VGVQHQDEGTPLAIRDLRHEGAGLMLNLKMTPEVVIHSLMRFEAFKTWSCATP